jgi:GT2 family glycosyltransferase
MRISFVIPSRNNLKYLKQAVESITRCYGSDHDIVLLDDASTDGTWDWIQSLEGEHFVKYRNEGPERVGHTILYDKGVELSRTEVFSILHADMVVSPKYVPNLLKHLDRRKVICATRVEPPLHPPGPEKFVKHLGLEPEEFSYEKFLEFIKPLEKEYKSITTEGIFAPWCMYKEDFQGIGGHDKLFAPMELEDSDLFNRMFLAGFKLIQARDAFVYHMTCRGSRFKDGLEIEAEIPLPDGTIWYKPKDSEEYKALRQVKFREWWRKWGCNVLHDELMLPVVPHRYNVGFVIHNCNIQLLQVLEPWCDRVYVNEVFSVGRAWDYVEVEQSNTGFDLSKRVLTIKANSPAEENDIVVEFDATKFTEQSYRLIQQLSQIITQSGEIGEFELDIFKITIRALNTYEHKLITNNDLYYTSQLRQS